MKYKYKSYSYVLLIAFTLLSLSNNLNAQSKRTIITGIVTSDIDSEPLTGATVAEVDENNRIIKASLADFSGNYSIQVSDVNNQLSFSFVGFKTQLIVPGNQKFIKVELKENVDELEAVEIRAAKKVFTGEFDIDKRRIATAMSTISTKEISETSPTQLVDQLQGRVSGLDIAATSGDVGAGMSIRIRGTSSLNASSEPLIVINGVPFETEIDALFDFGSADEQQYAALIGVSPNDIEEVSVLKDAAATAQYGSRAANGVLLIKTKRGAKGKAQFSYSYRNSIGWQPEGIPLLNGEQYSTLIKEEHSVVNDRNKDLSPVEFDPSYEFFDLYNNDVNWLDEITRLSTSSEHFLSVSGGGEKTRYRVSGSYKTSVGTTVGNDLTNFSTRAILDYDISDNISISTELAYTHGDLNNPYKSNIKPKETIRSLALRLMPNQSIFELDEEGNPTDIYFTPENPFQGSATEYYNPVAMANFSRSNIVNDRITPTFKFQYQLSKQFRFNTIVAFDINSDKASVFRPESAIGGSWTNRNANAAEFSDAEFLVMRTDNKITWTPDLGDNHSLFALGSFQTFEKTSQTYEVKTSNTPSSSIQTPVAASRIEGSGNELKSTFTKNTSLAYNFSFNYQLLDKYILSGGVRSEGNSKFGENFRYGVFPSVATKWLISEEPFLESVEFIDELGLRASYGVNGNSPKENYGQYNNYTSYDFNYLGERPVYPVGFELTDLRWERVTQKNIGISYSFDNYRFTGDIEYYSSRTEDFLDTKAKIPSTTGFSELPTINLGNLKNTGFEFSINAKLIGDRDKDFGLDVNFNIARNLNVVTKITDIQENTEGDVTKTGSEGYLRTIREGNAVGSFYGYRYLGVYSTTEDLIARDENGEIIRDLNGVPKNIAFLGRNIPGNRNTFNAGDAKYEDINHDGNIDAQDVVYLGNSNPLFYGGFGATIKYKNWNLISFFNFRLKQKIINLARMQTESLDGLDNQSTAALRRWRFEGDETDIPRAILDSPVNTLGSDRFLEDASFIRLKNITLRYNFPKSITDKLKIGTAMFFITGTNLFTFTEYSGPDPEAGIGGDWQKVGFDESQTPRSKLVTAGLNLTF